MGKGKVVYPAFWKKKADQSTQYTGKEDMFLGAAYADARHIASKAVSEVQQTLKEKLDEGLVILLNKTDRVRETPSIRVYSEVEVEPRQDDVGSINYHKRIQYDAKIQIPVQEGTKLDEVFQDFDVFKTMPWMGDPFFVYEEGGVKLTQRIGFPQITVRFTRKVSSEGEFFSYARVLARLANDVYTQLEERDALRFPMEGWGK